MDHYCNCILILRRNRKRWSHLSSDLMAIQSFQRENGSVFGEQYAPIPKLNVKFSVFRKLSFSSNGGGGIYQ